MTQTIMSQIKELEESERLTLDIPKHRAFTYQEKKLNKMTQAELIEYFFVPKIDVTKLIYHFLKERGEQLTVRYAKLIKLALEDESRKAIPPSVFDHIFNIFELKKVYKNLTTLESMAIHEIINEMLMEKYGRLDPGLKKSLSVIPKAIDQFCSNWDQAIEYLNKSQE